MNKYAQHSKADTAWQETRKRIHRRDALACIRKRRHKSEQKAKDWADERGFPYTRAYHCSYCNCYHLTTK